MKEKNVIKEFVCPKCGYEAYKLVRRKDCPLCEICRKCGFTVRHCTCKEPQ